MPTATLSRPLSRQSSHPSLLPLLAGEAALVVPAVAIAWLFGVPLADQFPSGSPLLMAVGRGVLATLPMLAVLAWLMRSRWRPIVRFRRLVTRLLGELLGRTRDEPPAGDGVAWLIAVSAAAGIGEELLFRGALQPLLVNWLGPPAGVLLASLLFGLAHPISRLYVALAAGLGLYLGCLALFTGELVSAMVAHSLYDFVALCWIPRELMRGEPTPLKTPPVKTPPVKTPLPTPHKETSDTSSTA
ncbi:MAG: CPBP family intramembrane glutamic endopeptidase [Planctomycetota bacterium]